MSNKEVIVKYIVDYYINYKKRKNGEDLSAQRQRFEDFLLYMCVDQSLNLQPSSTPNIRG